jgi:glutamate-1-semialdehyde 2,1-aminomutase/spore coat polysaccharide biosynthesis protein SpsF
MGSSRLPGKVLADLGGRPMIDWVIDRARRAPGVDAVIVATSLTPDNDGLEEHLHSHRIPVVRGDETDVLSRFCAAAAAAKADTIVRLTADCPFLDPQVISQMVRLRADRAVDYASNTFDRSFPDGLDVEVFTRAALDRANREARQPILREHVTPYISGKRKNVLPWGEFSTASLSAPGAFGHLRWTVDEAEDLEFARTVAEQLGFEFGWLDLVALLTRRPALTGINSRYETNEGSHLPLRGNNKVPVFERSNQFFSRAVESIPLASQTFSKSYQQWVKGASPLFLERGKGARVWDIDGNEYIDFVLALLPVVLGYRDPDVDAAISAQLERGIVFSLASPLEVELAERLKTHIPCAERVRFGKNGSDATTAAIRLARAFTGRDKVLLCGYHGWHDWYIGTTTRSEGVPAAIKALSAVFPYNDADALEQALKREPNAIAAVILEPSGAVSPLPGFLERVRELTARHGAVLIFDEIVTGFRVSLGGAQAHYGVTPDLATFGKAMANGMPISAILGRADIMDRMADVFISSTFGGETLSITAAIATIDKMARLDVTTRLWRLGSALASRFNALADKSGLGQILHMGGEGWWPRLSINKPPVSATLMTSLLRQEFVASGLLMGSSFNLCLAHDTPRVMSDTSEALERAFSALRSALDSPDPAKALRGEPFKPTFSVR